LWKVFGELEKDLSGALKGPGHYYLVIDPPQTVGLKQSAREIQELTKRWIIATAPELAIGSPETAPRHYRDLVVPGTSLRLRLIRFPESDGEFRIMFEGSPDLQSLRTAALQTAMSRKCPKLESERARHPEASSLLLLELRDALGCPFSVFDLVAEEVERMAHVPPDHIYLIDATHNLPPQIWVAKEETRLWSMLAKLGPQELVPSSSTPENG
jgi:hypothetical protein